MNIYYLSVTSFTDTDLGVLEYLSKVYNVTYGLVLQKTNANFTESEVSKFCKERNINFEPFRFKYQQKDPRTFLTFFKIIKKIKAAKSDVIYIPTFDHVFFSALSLLLDPRKTVIALHDVEFHSNAEFKKILIIARKITLMHFVNFQVFSDSQFRLFKKLSPGKKVTLIPSPLKNFGTADRVLPTDGNIRLLFFGNILPYKGLGLLLQALSNINEKEERNIKLILAGRCNDWDTEYEPLIKNNIKIERMIGFIDNEKIATLFTNADYLILPYKDATQSGPLKIAFNYNLPIIASDIDSFSEDVVDNVNGYLFKVGNVESLESVLLKILNNHDTAYQQLKIEQKNYVAAKYSDEVISSKFVNMFNNVLNQVTHN
ncbi:glycosyltransferase involved in cell wall biosynthesis [Mucilaginibacter oryzae]|uniref:Glycosyltransferase involved in cell wall biosynthesis n=1 Tax=Mucilaginibacter oryzae TaxID=468058 RepID=A0A316HBE7_9SPHI|nr:glycosyltransferase family 4 protein [Mucilaginibacter oryzae]PWK77727.1 glycosyltransferase involved in cell wall biosynthesis [Mucilaginibacter oryzae]